MKTFALLILFCTFAIANLQAQDAYHQSVQQQLSTDFNLQGGQWVHFDNELQNSASAYSYGFIDIIDLQSETENFTEVANILNEVEGNYSYDSGWGMENQNVINQGDVCLLVVNLRKTNNVNQFGKVNIFAQAQDNSVFELLETVHLEEDWNQYLLPFQATTTYQAGEFVCGLGTAWEVQEIEVAGMNVLNFGSNYDLEDLPFIVHNERYPGYEEDAPWRAEAEERIESARKSDLQIAVNDMNGNALENANVSIRMLDHEFGWGTAINLDRFAGNQQQEEQYEAKLLDLDGEGHTFNWVTPGASFKWPGIEEGWVAPFEQKVNAVNWLKDNDYKIRFHTLIWPGWINTPFDIEANQDDPQYILDRANEWIDFILGHEELQDIFDEYDVLNELTGNRDFENTFAGFADYETGREFYIEVMDRLSSFEPDKPQVINDYVTISAQQYKGAEYDFLQSTIQEVIDGGADLGGIGFQAHIGYSPTSIYEVETILTDFANQFDVPLKITEYDFIDPRIDQQVQADYLEDFLTMIFSIPQVDMFIFWGMWDVTEAGKGNLFNEDWTEKPAAAVFFDKVFDEWWTEEEGNTNQDGLANFRPFKGEFEILIEAEGETLVDTISINQDLQLTYTLDVLSSSNELTKANQVSIFPNPSSDHILIESIQHIDRIAIISVNGKLIKEQTDIASNRVSLPIADLASGAYFVKVSTATTEESVQFEVLH